MGKTIIFKELVYDAKERGTPLGTMISKVALDAMREGLRFVLMHDELYAIVGVPTMTQVPFILVRVDMNTVEIR